MGILEPAPMAKGTGYKAKWAIDFMKVMTLPVCLILLTVFGQWSNPTAVVYAALHGNL
jgi:hypothetical protein